MTPTLHNRKLFTRAAKDLAGMRVDLQVARPRVDDPRLERAINHLDGALQDLMDLAAAGDELPLFAGKSESSIEVETLRRCRECGCTEEDCSQCQAKTGEGCVWVDDDLCSACIRDKVPERVYQLIMDANTEEEWRKLYRRAKAEADVAGFASAEPVAIPPRREPFAEQRTWPAWDVTSGGAWVARLHAPDRARALTFATSVIDGDVMVVPEDPAFDDDALVAGLPVGHGRDRLILATVARDARLVSPLDDGTAPAPKPPAKKKASTGRAAALARIAGQVATLASRPAPPTEHEYHVSIDDHDGTDFWAYDVVTAPSLAQAMAKARELVDADPEMKNSAIRVDPADELVDGVLVPMAECVPCGKRWPKAEGVGCPACVHGAMTADKGQLGPNLRRATESSYVAAERWAELRATGASDDQIKRLLDQFWSGGWAAEGPDHDFQVRGGRVPAIWYGLNRWSGKSSLAGQALVAEVRRLLEIPEPTAMKLFDVRFSKKLGDPKYGNTFWIDDVGQVEAADEASALVAARAKFADATVSFWGDPRPIEWEHVFVRPAKPKLADHASEANQVVDQSPPRVNDNGTSTADPFGLVPPPGMIDRDIYASNLETGIFVARRRVEADKLRHWGATDILGRLPRGWCFHEQEASADNDQHIPRPMSFTGYGPDRRHLAWVRPGVALAHELPGRVVVGDGWEFLGVVESAKPAERLPGTLDSNLRRALHAIQGAAERWAAIRSGEGSDAAIRTQLGYEWQGGPGASAMDELRYATRGGSKPAFWWPAYVASGPPTLSGKPLIAAIRRVLEIPEPAVSKPTRKRKEAAVG